jgi:hypothetical protein
MTDLRDLNRDYWMDDEASSDDSQSLAEFSRQLLHQEHCEFSLKEAISSLLRLGYSKGRCSTLCETFIKEWR